MQENIKTFIELQQEHPDLPVICLVEPEIVFDSDIRGAGELGTAELHYYLLDSEGLTCYLDTKYSLSEKEDLIDSFFGGLEDGRTEDEIEELFKADLPWKQAIFVNVNTTEAI